MCLFALPGGRWSRILDCKCSAAHTAARGTQGGILGTEVLLESVWPGCITHVLLKKIVKTE